jgi:hypothetical protein
MVTMIVSSTETMWATYAILDSNRITDPLIVCTKYVEGEGRNCLSTSHFLKNMKALIANTTGDMRQVLQSSLGMQHVTSGNDTTDTCYWQFLVTLITSSCSTCSATWIDQHHLFQHFHLWMDVVQKHQIPQKMIVVCPEAQSYHPQFVLLRPQNIRPLMLPVLRTSTNCPTLGPLFWTTVDTDNTKRFLKGDPNWGSGFKIVETCLFSTSSIGTGQHRY